MAEMIECPKCKTKFEVTQALTAQLTDKLRAELESELAPEKTRLQKELTRLKTREQELALAEESITGKIKEGVSKEREKLEQAARQKVREEYALESKDRDQQLAELKSNLQKSKESELLLLRRERELKDKAAQQEIEFARKINEESDRIKNDARKQVLEETRLHNAEKDKKIGDLAKQIDDLKARLEQGSQQTQGEVMELALEELLKIKFPRDLIEPIAKGVRGADVLQRVNDAPGECGSILWESKRTRNWTHGWLEKLREDQRASNASVAIIVTAVMPEGCDSFTLIDGVWVTNWKCAVGLALALRASLVEIARANQSLVGKQEKAELVYDYLASPAFRNRVGGIVEAFVGLKKDLDQERRAIERLWTKREKQLERAITSTTRMYGDLQGIIGAQLPELKTLELPGEDQPTLPSPDPRDP